MAEKSGRIFNVILLLAVAVVGVVLLTRDTPDEIDKATDTPREALEFYLQASWDHLHEDTNKNLSRIERAVLPEDYQWFLENYESMFRDPFDISGGTDPTAMDAAKKHLVMCDILNQAPNRPDSEINSKKETDTTAVFTVKYLIDSQTKTHGVTDVTLVKHDGSWRVKGFAGARQRIQGGDSPIQYVQADASSPAPSSSTPSPPSPTPAPPKPDQPDEDLPAVF